MRADISVVILTFNEERNLPYALDSIGDWSDDIHIVDSGSQDNTISIAEQRQIHIHNHKWKDWADQRNWALVNCGLKYQWVLFLDADEQLTQAVKGEITANISSESGVVGYQLPFVYVFLDRPLRKAMPPHLRLVKNGHAQWRAEGAREYCSIPDAEAPVLKNKLIHHDHRGIGFWIEKQNKNATLEAMALMALKQPDEGSAPTEGKPSGLRSKLDRILSPYTRAFIQFVYLLLFRTSLRDGFPGVIRAIMQGYWYPMLVAMKYTELRQQTATQGKLQR